MNKRGYSTAQAAIYTGLSISYLRRARMDANDLDAPPAKYITDRKIVYLKEDLDQWLDQQTGKKRVRRGADK